MDYGRGQEIAEFAQHMRPDRALFIIANQGPDFILALADIEMVHPEPGQLFLELIFGIKVAQQRAGLRLSRQVGQLLLIGFLRGIVIGRAFQLLRRLLQLAHLTV